MIPPDNMPEQQEDSFPISVFPKPIREIISETKACLNYPTDYIASAICFTLSVGIGNNFVAKVKEGWDERAILYMAIIGRSGVNKSHPLSFAMQPLFELDMNSSVKYQKERKEYDRLLFASRKEKGSKEEKELPVEPVLKKFIVSDITPERLITIHQDNKRGICLYVDELMSWLKNFNRYNSGSEEQFWLSVFSGKPIILDRQGNKSSAFIKHSFISVIGTIQKGLLKELAKGERTENGFIDRILFVFPPNLKKEYWNECELSTHIAPLWESIIRKLTDIQCTTGENGELIPSKLAFSTEARSLLYKWQHMNTDLCNTESDDILVGVYSKLDIYIIRFSLILQLARWACDEAERMEIDQTSVEGAIAIVEYFRNSAKRVQEITNSSASLEQLPTDKSNLYNALPMEFTTGEGIKIAQKLNISADAFKRFLADKKGKLFENVSHGAYKKMV
ncbi:DUF3987 domain-containing protein [Bacteroides sp.]|uniref:DUF3987 domain-containing protein n=1 Tax=Bacteroides sp. TaxID=29523 RepID=UPI002611B214|nr:DUF3987 domain-containing protein [Bacteroides sp.]